MTIIVILDKDIALHTETYLGEGEMSICFTAGAMWMKDKILEML